MSLLLPFLLLAIANPTVAADTVSTTFAITQDTEQPDPATELQAWLREYLSGAIRFQKDGRTDTDAIALLDQRLENVAQQRVRRST